MFKTNTHTMPSLHSVYVVTLCCLILSRALLRATSGTLPCHAVNKQYIDTVLSALTSNTHRSIG